jgi:hypothetical protein
MGSKASLNNVQKKYPPWPGNEAKTRMNRCNLTTFRMFNCHESVFCWRTLYNGKAAYNYFVVHCTILVASELAGLSSRALNSSFF